MAKTIKVMLYAADKAGNEIDGRLPETIYIGRSGVTAATVRQAAIAAGTRAGAKVFVDGAAYLPLGEPERFLRVTMVVES